jgi:hypothetical protein
MTKRKVLADIPPAMKRLGYGKSKKETLHEGKQFLDEVDRKWK